MSELMNLLPENGRVVLTIINGAIATINNISSDHYISTLEGLIELLQAAGYTVTKG